jgi:ADP-ribose pyrophosphatase YjhB (NUDIX family)
MSRFKTCPMCEIRQALCETTIEGRLLKKCPQCGWIDWDPPVPVGVGLIDDHGRVVLVKRKIRPVGKWCLPAGFCSTNESPSDATRRETGEEANLCIVVGETPLRLLMVPNVNQLLLFFRAHSWHGEMKAGDDADAVGRFDPGKLPDMAFPLHSQVIRDYYASKPWLKRLWHWLYRRANRIA